MSSFQLYKRFIDQVPPGEVYCGDALGFLRSLDAECADLVFLDPPFNLGKRYINDDPDHDRRPETSYADWMTTVVRESVRILAPGGALYLYHLPIWAMRLGATMEHDLTFRHWIAIAMKNGFVRKPSLYPAHYALLYFTKGEPTTFHRPKLAPRHCRHCGKSIKDYGGYKEIIAKKGINLSDVWDDLSPVRHAKTKTRQQNQLPLTLTDRVVAISGSPGGLLVDPFAGSGSALLSAISARMRFKGCDLASDSCEIACQSICERVNSTSEINSNARSC